MSETRDDIIWSASIRALDAEICRRAVHVKKSLAALKNQDGLYADEHRRLIALFREILVVIRKAAVPKDVPRDLPEG